MAGVKPTTSTKNGGSVLGLRCPISAWRRETQPDMRPRTYTRCPSPRQSLEGRRMHTKERKLRSILRLRGSQSGRRNRSKKTDACPRFPLRKPRERMQKQRQKMCFFLPFLSELVRATTPFRKSLSQKRPRTLFRSTFFTRTGRLRGTFAPTPTPQMPPIVFLPRAY